VSGTKESTCGGHSGVGEELRALVLTALDRIGPVLDRIRDEQAAPGRPSEATCAVCPVCAVLAALHGERPELAARLAEQATGLLTVLRAALEEGAPAPADPPPSRAQPSPGHPAARRVEHIRVDRPAHRC
jgi:hypothetical protein